LNTHASFLAKEFSEIRGAMWSISPIDMRCGSTPIFSTHCESFDLIVTQALERVENLETNLGTCFVDINGWVIDHVSTQRRNKCG
jgi:hypothetical protein